MLLAQSGGSGLQALRSQNVSLRDESFMLRRLCAALEQQWRDASQRAHFKDYIIREMRRQLKQAKTKVLILSILCRYRSRSFKVILSVSSLSDLCNPKKWCSISLMSCYESVPLLQLDEMSQELRYRRMQQLVSGDQHFSCPPSPPLSARPRKSRGRSARTEHTSCTDMSQDLVCPRASTAPATCSGDFNQWKYILDIVCFSIVIVTVMLLYVLFWYRYLCFIYFSIYRKVVTPEILYSSSCRQRYQHIELTPTII